MRIYFDMDDVAVNFCGYASIAFGQNYEIGTPLDLDHWEALSHNHPRAFRDMKPNKEVLQAIKEYAKLLPDRVAFLTALPRDPNFLWQYAGMDKVNWCNTYAPGIPCFFGIYAHDKYKHCTRGDLLIDDKVSNCEEWEQAGGRAFLFRGDVKAMCDWINDKIVNG